MNEAIVVAFISGGLTLIGTVITGLMTSKKTTHKIQISQAVTEEKITELTREVREHNNFAKRMPVVEEQIRMINHILKNE